MSTDRAGAERGGRPRAVSPARELDIRRERVGTRTKVKELAADAGVSESTIQRVLRRAPPYDRPDHELAEAVAILRGSGHLSARNGAGSKAEQSRPAARPRR